MRMLLKFAYYGDPILRKKGDQIPEITDEIKTLVQNMVETLHQKRGLGLAAPQVHRSLALFIVQVPKENDEGKIIEGELIVFINPKILKVTKEKWIFQEGCLSIPKVYEHVERPIGVEIEFTNLDGMRVTRAFTDLEARAVMHENDHINGVLFIDRIFGKKKQMLEKQLQALKNTFNELRNMP